MTPLFPVGSTFVLSVVLSFHIDRLHHPINPRWATERPEKENHHASYSEARSWSASCANRNIRAPVAGTISGAQELLSHNSQLQRLIDQFPLQGHFLMKFFQVSNAPICSFSEFEGSIVQVPAENLSPTSTINTNEPFLSATIIIKAFA